MSHKIFEGKLYKLMKILWRIPCGQKNNKN
jgi:hypothetical protein